MIRLDMYGMDEYQSEKVRILYKNEKPNWHNIVQFEAAMTCLVKDLKDVDFGEAIYKKPSCREDWMILYNISKKFDNLVEYFYEVLVLWSPSWIIALISSSLQWRYQTYKKLPEPFTYLNNSKIYNTHINTFGDRYKHIDWDKVIIENSIHNEQKVILNKHISHVFLNCTNKNNASLGYYVTRRWNDLQFAFAALNYLTIRIAFDKYRERFPWRSLKEHKTINNPVNYNEIKQTVATVYKLHLSINTVNSILMSDSDFHDIAENNGSNYWI